MEYRDSQEEAAFRARLRAWIRDNAPTSLPHEAEAKVAALKPISFNYKKGYGDEGKFEQFGFFADEVAAVDERMASRGDDGKLKGVRYLEMPAVLAGAIQQLKADNDNLRADVEALKKKVALP